NCTKNKCSLNIPVLDEGDTYCVSAMGSFDELMFGTPSEESCIDVPLKQTSSSQYIIILYVFIGILSIMLILYYGCKKLREENITLPKSLVSVMRSLNTGTFLVPKPEGRYISQIHIITGQSWCPVNSEATLLEIEPEEGTVNPESSGKGESSVPTPEAPAKAEEVSVQESTEEVSYDADEQNYKGKESYLISDSSQMDICSNSSSTEVSATEAQQRVIPSSCSKFSGYDKPHVPVDMLMIDVGEEQPVNTYRPTV
ncbi:INGR1 protein, partial [Serilophus lunatus]|nr:INGR1 protein [Serilophus lunatus]